MQTFSCLPRFHVFASYWSDFYEALIGLFCQCLTVIGYWLKTFIGLPHRNYMLLYIIEKNQNNNTACLKRQTIEISLKFEYLSTVIEVDNTVVCINQKLPI